MTSTTADPADTASSAPAPRSRKRLWLLAAALLLAGAGGLAWWVSQAVPPPWLAAQLAHWQGRPKVSDPVFVPLEPFTVNLQPNGRSRFLHVAITLKVPELKAQALLVKYLPEVRSRVLTVLANREADQLLLPEEKIRLAQAIALSLAQPLAPGLAGQPITSVMFTTFMLQ